jgi:hypothetical protein
MNAPWYLPLLEPDEQFERGLPPVMLGHVHALRQAYAEVGPIRGIISRASVIAGGCTESNFHASLQSAANRLKRINQIRTIGVTPVAGLDVREVTERLGPDGKLAARTVRQGSPLGEVDPGAPLPGFAYKRVSTLANGAGEKVLEWKIQSPEAVQRIESARLFVEGLLEGKPPAPLVTPPAASDDDLLCVYPMGDPHFGMRAHAPESGDNFDLTIAERQTKAVVDRLVQAAPPARTALLLNLGDFFHADDDSAQTKRSGNKLDVDGRYHRVLRVGAWTMVHLIYRLLEKHERVEVWNERGNHDDTSALVLQVALGMHFAGNPRVTVNESPAYFHFMEFGRCLIGATHGDGPKEGELPGIMAHDQHEAWGRTKYRVFHRGHFHHDIVKDLTGCTVETHRTLAASDAWHRKSGYRAARDMKVITYHARYGEIARTRVNLDMIEEEAAA